MAIIDASIMHMAYMNNYEHIHCVPILMSVWPTRTSNNIADAAAKFHLQLHHRLWSMDVPPPT